MNIKFEKSPYRFAHNEDIITPTKSVTTYATIHSNLHNSYLYAIVCKNIKGGSVLVPESTFYGVISGTDSLERLDNMQGKTFRVLSNDTDNLGLPKIKVELI